MSSANPYLNFHGNCAEAFEHYKSVFGGEFEMFSRFGDMEGMPCPEEDKNKIMHVALPVGDSRLMGSDWTDFMGEFNQGNNFSVAITPDSREHADKLYAGLSEGGNAVMPMGDAPWGAYYGMCIDKFGVMWQINL